MENEKPIPISENDPSIQVRTDMWPTMNVSQLNRQREIMLDHVTKVQSMVDTNASVSVRNMFGALQVGLEDLNKLIDAKYAEKQKL